MKRIIAVVCLSVCLVISGCNPYQRAEMVNKVVASVLAIAGAEVPQFPANEQPIITGFVTAGTSLNTAYGACIDNANQAMLKKSAKFLDCLGIFSKALNDPQLLAQLRVLNPKSTKQVQLWLTGVTVAVNEAIIWFGGQAPPTPTVGPAPSTAELREFKSEVLNGM
jgi:hypothetical protein